MQTGSTRTKLKRMLPFTHISVQTRLCPSCCLCALRSTSSSLFPKAAPLQVAHYQGEQAKPRRQCGTSSISKGSLSDLVHLQAFLCHSFLTEITPPFLHLSLHTPHQPPTPNPQPPTPNPHTHRGFCHSAEMSM